MHEMPFNNSTVTTGKEEPSKSEKTDTPTPAAFKVAKVDLVVDLEPEVAMVVALEQEAEVSVVEVDSLVVEAMEADSEAEADSKEEGAVVAGLVVNREGMEVLPKKLLHPTLSPTLLLVVASVAR